MGKYKEESKCLASLTVFGELYNKQHDVYKVISLFLNDIIFSNRKVKYSLVEIVDLLEETYDFTIPNAVIKVSLKRLKYLKKECGYYVYNETGDVKSNNIESARTKIKNDNKKIIEALFHFIENEKKIKLDKSEKNKITHSFSCFLLNDSNGEGYYEYISSFIVKNSDNLDFQNKLSKIREGVILYLGLKYSNNASEIGSWNKELTIFLDTEIIFHFAGYHGTLVKKTFEDFFNYVKEINQKSEKKLIKLKYFKEVMEEVEQFFYKAKCIVEGKEMANPKFTAMTTVLNGCTSAKDVLAKKTMLKEELKRFGILEDTGNFYFEENNYEYNIIDKTLIDTLSKELEFDITENLTFLNYINILRGDYSLSNLDDIKYVLLTGKSKTLKLAWHETIKKNGKIPLAITLDWITNKFWFKLNKGFGKDNFPSSFDVITRAQVSLSSVLNETIGYEYDKLMKKYKYREVSPEIVYARITDLRKEVRNPEEILQDDISTILGVINEDTLEKFVEEHEKIKIESKLHAKENQLLKETLESHLKENEQLQEKIKSHTKENKELQEKVNQQQNVSKKIINTSIIDKKKLLIEEEREVTVLVKKIESEIKKGCNRFKCIALIIIIGFYFTLIYFIEKYTWNAMEKWVFYLGIPAVTYSFLYYIVFREETELKEFFGHSEKWFISKIYKINIKNQKLIQLKSKVEERKKEIQSLENILN